MLDRFGKSYVVFSLTHIIFQCCKYAKQFKVNKDVIIQVLLASICLNILISNGYNIMTLEQG